MKYNININQKYLAENTDLDVKDGALLDYLYYFCNSQSDKINKARITNEKGIWTWVNYDTLLKEMPLLKIKSKSAISNRIRKLERNGFLITWQPENRKLYIKLEQRVDKLFIEMRETDNNRSSK